MTQTDHATIEQQAAAAWAEVEAARAAEDAAESAHRGELLAAAARTLGLDTYEIEHQRGSSEIARAGWVLIAHRQTVQLAARCVICGATWGHRVVATGRTVALAELGELLAGSTPHNSPDGICDGTTILPAVPRPRWRTDVIERITDLDHVAWCFGDALAQLDADSYTLHRVIESAGGWILLAHDDSEPF